MDQKKKQIQSFINKKNIPNLLIYGPYLNGKNILCNEYLSLLYPNHDDLQKYVLRINCLNTNGIQHLKENIKLFSMQIVHKTKHISFKTIVLKHAEFLTYDSQYSLRRTIEQYCNHTRFILLCDNKKRLLQPICSRFVHIYLHGSKTRLPYVRFDPFPYYKMNKYIKRYHNIIDENQGLIAMMNLAQEMYYNHFFAKELLTRFKNHVHYPIVCCLFEKYSREFRNEILSILYLLNVFRNNSEIQILDLY
jgi:DNA polymerase III delta prime subunit